MTVETLTPHVLIVLAVTALITTLHVDALNVLDNTSICFDHARKPRNLCAQQWMSEYQKHSCNVRQWELDLQCDAVTGRTSETLVDNAHRSNP